jgi:uncharacterized protein (TIGR02285 family)
LSLVIVLHPASSRAQDTLYWQQVNWPPYLILQGDDAGKGQYDKYIKLFQEKLPQYEHQNIEMNWSRFWEDIKLGKHVLNSMAIKTDERTQFAYFSQPISIVLPHRIIFNSSTLAKMGNPESVSLSDIIRVPGIHGILEQKRSYSTQLDDILDKADVGVNFDRKVIDAEQVFKMLITGRADYTIEYPAVINYLTNKHHTDKNISLNSVRIQELPRYIESHIAAPKTPWGLAVIQNIDNIVDGLKTTNRFLEIQKMYTSDQKELDEIQNIYEEVLLGQRPTVTISMINRDGTHAMVEEVLTEAYKRIGYKAQFKLLPGKRSLEEANQGKTDGDTARITGTEKDFPNLIQIPTPLVNFQANVFTLSVKKEIKDWSDLKGLRIGVVRGVRYATKGTEGMNPFFAENVAHLFQLLMDNRIDVAVTGWRQGEINIRRSFGTSGIHPIGEPLLSAHLYHYVHKKNKDLVLPLDKVLTEMAAEGEIDMIVDRAFQVLQIVEPTSE